MRLISTLLALALALAPGCASDCEESCDHLARICAEQVDLARGLCISSCEDNLARCANQAERTACVAAANTCSAVDACPPCR